MAEPSQSAFRAVALERAASPEQLDYLVRITRPSDWILLIALAATVVAGIVWGIFGRVPTRAPAEGILVAAQGRVVDAVSAAVGRLGSLEVAQGDHVSLGQPIARIVQTDTRRRYEAATDVYRERQTEHEELKTKVARELAVKNDNFTKLETALGQVIKATEQRIEYLTTDVRNLEDLFAKGYTTRRNVEDRRKEMTDAQQRKEDTRNEILKLRTQQTDLQTQRERDIQNSEFKMNDARREMDILASSLNQDTQILSPLEGRVIEIKVSPGTVLAVGTAVISIESEGAQLQAVVYIPAERGKNIKAGMEARIAPTTVKREEFGTMLGTVTSVSDFPVTPQGMTAVLHNENLVKSFSHEGAPYAATVTLQADPGTPSGYRWAVGKGPPLKLTSGTLLSAEITTRKQRPLDLVVPLIKRITGLDG